MGDVVSVMSIENVGYWHQAHSFVRGNMEKFGDDKSDDFAEMLSRYGFTSLAYWKNLEWVLHSVIHTYLKKNVAGGNCRSFMDGVRRKRTVHMMRKRFIWNITASVQKQDIKSGL